MGRSNKNTLKKTISKASYMAGPMDGLPEGWRVEIKTRERGKYAGNKYKESSIVPEAHIQESSVTKTHVGTERKNALDELPLGWTVDIKVRKSGTKFRADPYYTDPGTGYVFRSKKDALRYVKTGELGKYAFKPRERRTNNVNEGDITTSKVNDNLVEGHQTTGKCSNLDELVNDEPVFVGQCSKSDEPVNDGPTMDAEASEQDEAVNGESAMDSSAMRGGDMELSRPFFVKNKSFKKRKGRRATFANGTPTNKTTYVPPIENRAVENGGEEHKRQTRIGSKKRKKVEFDTPRRVSKRLAGIPAEVVTLVEKPSGTLEVDAVGQPPEAKPAVNSTGPDVKLASEMEEPYVTSHVEAVEQPPETKLAVNASGTDYELASDLEGPNASQAASVEPPSGSKFAASLTSVDSACLVSVQFNQLEPEKAGNCVTDPFSGEIHLKQEGSLVITEEVTATTWASGEYLEQGTSDTRREEQTTQSQPLLDHIIPGKLGFKTQADGNLGGPLVLPFGELWPDPCLEFAYKTLTGVIPVDDGEVGITTSNTFSMSDPCMEFAYNTLTGAIPVGDIPSTACPDVITMSDPCMDFAYKTLTGTIPMENALPVTFDAIPVENTLPATFTDAIPTSDPCIEFAYRTLIGGVPVEVPAGGILTGGVPVETPARVENSQAVPVPVPGGVPLSDPCLEFAYKTLIGAIPLEESLAVQGYLQQQSSALTRNDNLVDGFFGSVVKPTSMNKLQNESVRASQNESLQNFSNVVQHPKGVEEIG